MQKQLLLAQAKAKYEKISANRVRSVQQKQEKESVESLIDKLFTEVNSLKLKLRGVIAGRK